MTQKGGVPLAVHLPRVELVAHGRHDERGEHDSEVYTTGIGHLETARYAEQRGSLEYQTKQHCQPVHSP